MELNTFDTGSMVMCQDVYILYSDGVCMLRQFIADGSVMWLLTSVTDHQWPLLLTTSCLKIVF